MNESRSYDIEINFHCFEKKKTREKDILCKAMKKLKESK